MTSRGKCKHCHATIIWIKQASGRMMPCDPTPIAYIADPKGPEKIETLEGEIVRGWRATDRATSPPTGLGYIPHFATCKHYAAFKRLQKMRKAGGGDTTESAERVRLWD